MKWMLSLLAVIACAPALRIPGPTRGMGRTGSAAGTSLAHAAGPTERGPVGMSDAVAAQAPGARGAAVVDAPRVARPATGRAPRSDTGAPLSGEAPPSAAAFRGPAPVVSSALPRTPSQVRAPRTRPAASGDGDGRAVARAAVGFIDHSALVVDGVTYRFDCSGLVNAAYAAAGYDLGLRSSAALFELAKELDVEHRNPRPAPGDVLFFDHTTGPNDPLSHVAIVESVDENGTITFVHRSSSQGVVRAVMNLEHPDVHMGMDGTVYNSYLRGRSRHDPPGSEYLAGQLWRGNASFWKATSLQGAVAEGG